MQRCSHRGVVSTHLIAERLAILLTLCLRSTPAVVGKCLDRHRRRRIDRRLFCLGNTA
jgi:hypothetical protein